MYLSRNIELDQIIRQGVPAKSVVELAESLAVPKKDLAGLLHISMTTIHRKISHRQRLTVGETDRLVRIARLFAKAAQVLETEKTPVVGFPNDSMFLKSNRRCIFAGHIQGLLKSNAFSAD